MSRATRASWRPSLGRVSGLKFLRATVRIACGGWATPQRAHAVDTALDVGMVRAPQGTRAPIAQLDRALVYGTRCRKFESSWARLWGEWAPIVGTMFVTSSAMSEDSTWMNVALEEARTAAVAGEVPVGCVIVDSAGRELARGRNGRESLMDPTAHAEVLAIRSAAAHLGGWRLSGTTAYVTLEPCAMCAGALVLARVARVVYGCADPKAGAVTTMFGIGRDGRLNHTFEVADGICEQACAEELRRFFCELRARTRAG
jgi:tRNA(adenine34) deaminase